MHLYYSTSYTHFSLNLTITMEHAQDFLTKYRENQENLVKLQEELSIERERENSLASKLKI